MKPRPNCLPCVLHQALQVARQVSDDEWSQRKVLNEVLRALPEAEWEQSSPAEVLEDAIKTARATLKQRDPYAKGRSKIQGIFKELADAFRETLASAEDPFTLAVTAATSANLVDEIVFDRFARLDPRGVFKAGLTMGFALGDPAELRESVDEAKTILYLLDNAGEVYFDAILIDQLEKLGKTVRTAVRGGGLLHDATLDDAIAAGLGDDPEASEPPDYVPGIDDSDEKPKLIPKLIDLAYGDLALPSFALTTDLGAAYDDADLVISKGSANFETMRKSRTRTVVHLLRVKCPPVASELGVRKGSLVLHRQKATEPKSGPTA